MLPEHSYQCQFEHTGMLQDIQYAILYRQQAIDSTPAGHTDLPGYLNNIGASYQHQFEHTGILQDIQHAILYMQQAVDSTPAGHAHLPGYLNNLGSSYHCQFEHTVMLQDIQHAILYKQQAVELTPAGHVHLPGYLNNLGLSYRSQFEHTGMLQDICHAIFYQHRAVQCIATGHALYSRFLMNLGNYYHQLFSITHNPLHIQYSLHLFRQSSQQNGPPSIHLQSAKAAAQLSVWFDRSHCLEDFSVAIDLLSEVAGLEQAIFQRYANLYGHSEFVTFAVAAALDFNRFDLDLALEWLENGRCLVWNQLNQLRTPIDRLKIKHPELANDFIKSAHIIELHANRSAIPLPLSIDSLSDSIAQQKIIQEHTNCATKYKETLSKIQQLPDFENFLKPPRCNNILKNMPQDGPVIIFNLHWSHCDALALVPGAEEPLHIPLKDFSFLDAQELQKNFQEDILHQQNVRLNANRKNHNTKLYMRDILKELWFKVIKPIIKALDYSVCYFKK